MLFNIRITSHYAIAVLSAFLLACAGATLEVPTAVLDFDFSGGTQGWTAQFADYPRGSESSYQLASGYRKLPAPLSSRSGFFISGNNYSDDLFMYIERHVSGLESNTQYLVSLTVEFATDVPTGCGGTGGSPGEGVFVKAGASGFEPKTYVDGLGSLRLNIDKGNQGNSGTNAVVIGNVANSTLCAQNIRLYEIKQLQTERAVLVTTDGTGSVWLLVGTDSGFEAITTLYYTRITAAFSRQ